MRPTQAIKIFSRVPWPSIDIQVKFYGDRPRGTPPSGELSRRWVAEYSDLVPKSVTLNDLEWRNSPNGTVISPHSVNLGADYVKVVEQDMRLFQCGSQEAGLVKYDIYTCKKAVCLVTIKTPDIKYTISS